MLVTCFLWRSTQMCALWAMVSNNQLFHLSESMHLIYFFVFIDISKATGKIIVSYFSYFPKLYLENIEAAQLQGNYFWSMELLQGCWYKGGGLYSAKAVKRWKRTRRQWKPIKVEQREPSPPQSLLQILIHYIILKANPLYHPQNIRRMEANIIIFNWFTSRGVIMKRSSSMIWHSMEQNIFYWTRFRFHNFDEK